VTDRPGREWETCEEKNRDKKRKEKNVDREQEWKLRGFNLWIGHVSLMMLWE